MTAPQKPPARPRVDLARDYLAQAQDLNEVPYMRGHAFFLLGCAVKQLIDEAERLGGLLHLGQGVDAELATDVEAILKRLGLDQ
jgi:hypothetical protein